MNKECLANYTVFRLIKKDENCGSSLEVHHEDLHAHLHSYSEGQEIQDAEKQDDR